MISRKEIEEREFEILAPYAVFSKNSKGRRYPEREDDQRTCFQRDRDRILHSTAFRRLQYKTQVFVNDEGDHYRTRLTHTLEVAQIARSIASTLKLNEDLAESLALSHDLGHGPFGHAGQDALALLMKNYGGFNHNFQVLRIVEDLEESYPKFKGLNLTFEVREGLRKHTESKFFSLEAQIVDLADEIAYNSHDLDDGIRAGFLSFKELAGLRLWEKVLRRVRREFGQKINPIQKRRMAIRFLINAQVKDIVGETLKRIHLRKIKTVHEALKDRHIANFSSDFKLDLGELKKYLSTKLYKHPNVFSKSLRGKEVIKTLFKAYIHDPKKMPTYARSKVKRFGLRRTVCDYIAGMTDRFAEEEYSKLF